MPGWHNATESLQDVGSVQMVGIIQEQPPDRARLFMQWKQMGWPILVDSYDLLGAPYVPISLAIDESGVIRKVMPATQKDGSVSDDFLEESFGSVRGEPAPAPPPPDVAALYARARSEGTAEAWKAYGDAIAVWGGSGRVDQAVDAYEWVVREQPEDGMAHFRLGRRPPDALRLGRTAQRRLPEGRGRVVRRARGRSQPVHLAQTHPAVWPAAR